VGITLKGPYGTISGSDLLRFSYLAVTGLSATAGPTTGDNLVLISGTGLYHAVAAYFGGTEAEAVIPVSNTEMYALAPPGSGMVDVRVLTGGGLSPAAASGEYTYSASAEPVAPPPISSTPPEAPTDSSTPSTSGGSDVATTDPAEIEAYYGALPPAPSGLAQGDDAVAAPAELPSGTAAFQNPVALDLAQAEKAPNAPHPALDTQSAFDTFLDHAADWASLGAEFGKDVSGGYRTMFLQEAAKVFSDADGAFLTNPAARTFSQKLQVLMSTDVRAQLYAQARDSAQLVRLFGFLGHVADVTDAANKTLAATFEYGPAVSQWIQQKLGANPTLSTALGGLLTSETAFAYNLAVGQCLSTVRCALGVAWVYVVARATYLGLGQACDHSGGYCDKIAQDLVSLTDELQAQLGQAKQKVAEWAVLIDPSGQVFDTQGTPVAGATATLLNGPSSSGPFSAMSTSGGLIEPATNPETTDADGTFDWDAAPGWYEVSAGAPGCTDPADSTKSTVFTDPFPLPPPTLGLNLTLDCPDLPPPPAATVISLSAASGPADGGGAIDVVGTGFTPASVVDFGETPATSVKLISSTALQVVVPAGSGSVDVTVNSQGGTSQTSEADVYSYLSVPTVSGLSVSSGSSSGGAALTVAGSGFTGASAVSFGTSPAGFVRVASASQLEAIAPPGTGTVDVTVATEGGTSAATSVDRFTYTSPPPPSGGGGPGEEGGAGGSDSGGSSGGGGGLDGSEPVCLVPRLSGLTLGQAKRALHRNHCQLGTVRKPKHSRRKHVLRVRGQAASAGSTRSLGSRVGVELR
jgi:hypothetical protein